MLVDLPALSRESRIAGDKGKWKPVRFGDVVRNCKVTVDPEASGLERYVAGEHMDTNDLRIRRWGTIGDGYLGPAFHRKFVAGQVLYGSRRTYLRKVAVADFDGICANTTFVLETSSDELIPELLPFIMQTEDFTSHSIKNSKGSVNPYVNWKDIASYEFALPPLYEQRRIAEVLWAADDACNHAVEVVDRLQFVHSTWFGSIAAEGLRESEHECGTWQAVPLQELWTQSPRSGFSAHPVDRETGVYVLALSALTAGGYRSGELKSVEDQADVRGSRLQKGDFLISRSNTIDRVGFVGIFDETRHDVSYPDTMMRFEVNEERVHKRFLERVMLSAYGRSYMRSIAAGTSSSMKKINRTGLGALIIPLPSLALQHALVAQDHQFLRAIDAARGRDLSVCSLRKRLVDSLIQCKLMGDAADVQ